MISSPASEAVAVCVSEVLNVAAAIALESVALTDFADPAGEAYGLLRQCERVLGDVDLSTIEGGESCGLYRQSVLDLLDQIDRFAAGTTPLASVKGAARAVLAVMAPWMHLPGDANHE